MEGREAREKGGTATATEGEGGKGEGDKSGGFTLPRGETSRNRPRREGSDTETEAAGGEAGTSQSRYKKGHMTNIYLTDSDKEALLDFLKDYEELYDKINEHFKDKARK